MPVSNLPVGKFVFSRTTSFASEQLR